jgi:hypothetical protein
MVGLKKRGYNDKVIESGFSKASEIDRNDLLEYKEKRSTNGFPLFSLTDINFGSAKVFQ